MWKEQLITYIHDNDALMTDLRILRSLELPQGYIAAGYIRNYVWDRLHGFPYRDSHSDIDVVYFDTTNNSEARDLELEQQLIRITGSTKWSVKNQARMHIRNGEAPYESIEDALSRWPETATAVGARLDALGGLQVCAPYGLEDLFLMTVRQSPLFDNREYFLNRVSSKKWLELWPRLTVVV